MISDDEGDEDDEWQFAARGELLPSDVLGRIACVLAGTLFVVLGGGSLAMLIMARRGWEACFLYEISIVVLLMGGCFVLWGVLAPAWLERAAKNVVVHFLLLLWLLLIPLLIQVFVIAAGIN